MAVIAAYPKPIRPILDGIASAAGCGPGSYLLTARTEFPVKAAANGNNYLCFQMLGEIHRIPEPVPGRVGLNPRHQVGGLRPGQLRRKLQF